MVEICYFTVAVFITFCLTAKAFPQFNEFDPFNGPFGQPPQNGRLPFSNGNGRFPQSGNNFGNNGFNNFGNEQFPQSGGNFGGSGFSNAGDISGQQRQIQQGTPPTSTTTTPSPLLAGCIANCQTQTVGSYNPVCGTNGQTYNNRQKMDCARRCGVDVQVSYFGFCGRNPGGK